MRGLTLLAVVGSCASGSLGGPRERTVIVPTAGGGAVYRAAGMGGAQCEAALLCMDKNGSTFLERGYVLSSRVIVRCDDPSAVPIPAGASGSTIQGLDGYLLIDTRSVREASAVARAMQSWDGVRSAHVDVERPQALRDVPTDPFVELEWHFRNLQDPGIDANFGPAWEAGYSGAGCGGWDCRAAERSDQPSGSRAKLQQRGFADHPPVAGPHNGSGGHHRDGGQQRHRRGAGGAFESQFSSLTIGNASATAEAFLHRNDINGHQEQLMGAARCR